MIATILPGHSDQKYRFPALVNETETRYRVALVVMSLNKNDTGFEYQLEAINVLGQGVFHVGIVDVPENLTTVSTTVTTASTTSPTTHPPPPLASRGIIIGVSTFVGVVFLAVVGILVFKNYKKHNETHPMTNINVPR